MNCDCRDCVNALVSKMALALDALIVAAIAYGSWLLWRMA
jgi:hypothetical protein